MTGLSVVIVNWNVRALLDKCLASLCRAAAKLARSHPDGPLIEIIVVDSASADGSAAMVREKYPTVKLLPQKENWGFTRGSNIGLAQARAPYLLLLNPDTELDEDALIQMFDCMEQHPEVGILGPHTLNTDGSHQSTRRRFPTLMTGLFESTWLTACAPASVEAHYRMLDTDDWAIMEADWVQGSAMMVRRALYADIGGLDESFVMYAEEMDWCKRAKAAGWKVVYHGRAFITHHGGKSSEQAGAFKQIHFHTSKLRYFRKHHGVGHYFILRASIWLQFLWQLILEGGKGLLGHKRELRRRRVKVYWQVLRSGLKAELCESA